MMGGVLTSSSALRYKDIGTPEWTVPVASQHSRRRSNWIWDSLQLARIALPSIGWCQSLRQSLPEHSHHARGKAVAPVFLPVPRSGIENLSVFFIHASRSRDGGPTTSFLTDRISLMLCNHQTKSVENSFSLSSWILLRWHDNICWLILDTLPIFIYFTTLFLQAHYPRVNSSNPTKNTCFEIKLNYFLLKYATSSSKNLMMFYNQYQNYQLRNINFLHSLFFKQTCKIVQNRWFTSIYTHFKFQHIFYLRLIKRKWLVKMKNNRRFVSMLRLFASSKAWYSISICSSHSHRSASSSLNFVLLNNFINFEVFASARVIIDVVNCEIVVIIIRHSSFLFRFSWFTSFRFRFF